MKRSSDGDIKSYPISAFAASIPNYDDSNSIQFSDNETDENDSLIENDEVEESIQVQNDEINSNQNMENGIKVSIDKLNSSGKPKFQRFSSFIPVYKDEKNSNSNSKSKLKSKSNLISNVNIIYNKNDENYCYLGLNQNESISIVGQFLFDVLKGSVSYLGAELSTNFSQSYEIHSPTTHSIPSFIAISSQDSNNNNNTSNQYPNLLKNYPTIILIRPLLNGFENISKVCPLFKDLWSLLGPKQDRFSTFSLIYESTNVLRPLQINDTWNASLDNLLTNKNNSNNSTKFSSILLYGSKSSGKSTFSRILTNKLLSNIKKITKNNNNPSFSSYSHVAYLDLDPGQPEFLFPGVVSLHDISSFIFGPSFTHSFTFPLSGLSDVISDSIKRKYSLIAARYIGDKSLNKNPCVYISAIHELCEAFKIYSESKSNKVVLIINCPGWTKGLGSLLFEQIFSFLPPISDVISLQDNSIVTKNNNVSELDQFLPANTFVYNIEHQINNSRLSTISYKNKFTPASLRTLMNLSYFHAVAKISSNDNLFSVSWDFNNLLIKNPPYAIKFSCKNLNHMEEEEFKQGTENKTNMEKPNILINGLYISGDTISNKYFLDALNGSIVGIVKKDICHKNINNSSSALIKQPFIQNVNAENYFYPVIRCNNDSWLSTAECLGSALIQTTDSTKEGYIRLYSPFIMFIYNYTNWLKLKNQPSLKENIILVKGSISLPLWDIWSRENETNFGVKWENVPYLSINSDNTTIGSKTWRPRRNVARK